MAGDWIKMRSDLGDDPAVIAIASSLGVSEFEVVGRLHWLWSWADRHTTDGVVTGVTEEWIDRRVGRGTSGAMIAAGWLTVDRAGALVFPGFDKHNGRTAKERALDARRKAESRSCPDDDRTDAGQAPDETGTRERETKALPKTISRIEEGATSVAGARANAAAALPLPPQFSLPEEWRQDARQLRPDWSDDDVLAVFLGFRDHFVGTGGRRADWRAAFRKWVRDERRTPGRKAKRERGGKAAGYDEIVNGAKNGRVIDATAGRVGSAIVRPLPLGVRQPGGDDVGQRQPDGPAANVG